MTTTARLSVAMTEQEVMEFLQESRTATLATLGPTGTPHLVAMWFAVLDGQVWFETKARSQKALNLRRDPRLTCMVESGWTYDTLHGVALEGTGVLVDDPEALWRLGVAVWERYSGPYDASCRPLVEAMLRKRVAVRVEVERVRSWDHRKLGLPAMPLGGTTAAGLPWT